MTTNVAPSTDARVSELLDRMAAVFPQTYASPRFRHVTDPALAARERRAWAESLIADDDRRQRALLTAPCEWCGRTEGERVATAGTVMHPACEREFAQDLGYLPADFAPLMPASLLPAPCLPAWDDARAWEGGV